MFSFLARSFNYFIFCLYNEKTNIRSHMLLVFGLNTDNLAVVMLSLAQHNNFS